MAATLLMMVITLAAIHWLLKPWLDPLQTVLQLQWLPWLGLGLTGWLLAGDSSSPGES